MLNPYLTEWQNLTKGQKDIYGVPSIWTARQEMVQKYAWAIPSEEALVKIVRYSPIIEIGAGSGYWAWMIRIRGGEIEAFDTNPPLLKKNKYSSTQHSDVRDGDHSALKGSCAKTLMICWPPYESSMASKCLESFDGDKLIYIGEGYGGCTADDKFFELLEQGWTEEFTMGIPQWPGIHDYLAVYSRINTHCQKCKTEYSYGNGPKFCGNCRAWAKNQK